MDNLLELLINWNEEEKKNISLRCRGGEHKKASELNNWIQIELKYQDMRFSVSALTNKPNECFAVCNCSTVLQIKSGLKSCWKFF